MITAKNSRELIKGAFENKAYDRIPIWFMRQAGRYLPEYMVIREKYSFEERCMNPDIASEITIQPINRFDLDAAVVFSDILIPIYEMKVGLSIIPGRGPVIEQPIRTSSDVENLIVTNAKEHFSYQSETIKLVRKDMPNKAIVGFAGAPFTLASYLIEGKSTRDALLTKSFAYRNSMAFEKLLDLLTDIVIDQLQVQVSAGADFLQVFDSWVGFLSPQQFSMWAYPYLMRIFDAFPDIPTVFYARGSAHLFPIVINTKSNGINVDYTMSLSDAHRIAPSDKLLQGNLDPALLLTNPKLVEKSAKGILDEIQSLGRFNYIFNLSTGINKDSSLECVKTMVDTVKNYRRSE